MLRVASEHERVVVARLGRIVRLRGPGLVLWWPLIERATTVSLRATQFELGVTLDTADGATVHVQATGRCRVADPARTPMGSPDPISAAISEIQDRIVHEVSQLDLVALHAERSRLETAIPRDVSAIAAAWGVQVDVVELVNIEVRLTRSLAAQLSGGG